MAKIPTFILELNVMDNILNNPPLIFFLFTAVSLTLILLSYKLPTSPKPEQQLKKTFCTNHMQTRSTSFCHICSNPYCPDCLREYSTLSFCLDHFRLLEKYRWIPILSFEITSEQNENGLILQNFKEMIWKKENIPSYIVVEYRINFEQDLIESHMSYFTREQDQAILAKKFQSFRNRN